MLRYKHRTKEADRPRHYSIRASLIMLVAASALPALGVSVFLSWQNHQQRQAQVYRETVLAARSLTARLDRELSGLESALWVLSSSPDLQRNDLAAFHRRATIALAHQFGNNYVLTNSNGQQLMNTLRPFDERIPDRPPGQPMHLKGVFESGGVALSDLFYGQLAKQPLVTMGVPVYRNNEIAYALSTGIRPERLEAIFMEQALPEGWIAALLDSSGTIVARSVDGNRYIGQKAIPDLARLQQARQESTLETKTKDGVTVFTALSHSSKSRWSVAVGAPRQILLQSLYQSLLQLAAGTMLALALGLWLAVRLSRNLSASVRGLILPALALSRGKPVVLQPTRLKEADSLSNAIRVASERMNKAQHLAHHDPLTGLCNRLLFNELLTRHLSLARRTRESLSVLAIDLNDFKAVNDRHGHAAGDQVLVTAAERLLSCLRESDVAARLGGDEFAVILESADHANAQAVSEKLMRLLAEPYPGIEPRVSASVGIASFPQAGSDAKSLMEAADAALYIQKKADQVEPT